MSDDQTVINAVHTAEQNQTKDERSSSQTGQQVGRTIGGMFGSGIGNLAGSLGGALSGKLKGTQSNVKDMSLEDGTPAKIAIGASHDSPVALVVTDHQVSIAIGAEHKETIVTVADGKITVGNPQKHQMGTVDNPELAAAMERAGRGSISKNIDQNGFDDLAAKAVEAMNLATPVTPVASKPAKGAHK